MLLEVEEVVVEVDGLEFHAGLGELLADLDGGGGLAGGAGARDDDHADFGQAVDDQLGAGLDFLVVAVFAGGDELGEAAVGDDLVDAVDGLAAVVHVPAEDFVDLLVGDVVGGLELVGALGAGHGAFLAVADVGAGGGGVAGVDEGFLDDVLDLLDGGRGARAVLGAELLLDEYGEAFGFVVVGAADGAGGLEDGGGDAPAVVGDDRAVAFDDLGDVRAHARSSVGRSAPVFLSAVADITPSRPLCKALFPPLPRFSAVGSRALRGTSRVPTGHPPLPPPVGGFSPFVADSAPGIAILPPCHSLNTSKR